MIASMWVGAGILAMTGTVVDRQGVPIEGAEACLTTQGRALLCVVTDANGFWRLPDSAAEAVRVVKTGYLPGESAAVTQAAPIVLDRAATLLVRVVDGAGNPVEKGTVTVVYASGRKIGPLPFNRAGMRTPSLPPGAVRITAEAEGFDPADPAAVTLEAGVEREAVVRMTRR
ncbi:MAG TPA: carboxypeptidase-like regulatory domain-containing protein [Candidatus Polarisedimenticolaceae bacterium]